MKKTYKIMIADDHAIFRKGLRHTIESVPHFEVVAEAGDGAAALQKVIELKPDILVSDVSMPKMNGFELVKNIRQNQIPVSVVFLTIHDEEDIFSRAMELDVKCYVLKDSALVDIQNCLQAVVAGQHFTSSGVTGYLVKRAFSKSASAQPLAALNDTERKILRMVAEYKTSKEIAENLFLSPRTIENYRTNICSKLDLRGSHALMKWALQNRDKI